MTLFIHSLKSKNIIHALSVTGILILFLFSSAFAEDGVNRIIVHTDVGASKISKNIYGHFAEHLGHCIYGGIWVGEDSSIPNTRGIRNDVIEALREIDPPVIRWPGGCFADTYHWMDGIGPKDERPAIINSTWGGVSEDNSFGTHEFLDFCSLIGAEPYLCLNVGSGTVQEAADWVEYVNSGVMSPMTELRKLHGRTEPWQVKFWAVGNESWGCGGHMTPEYYTDLFKQYSTYLRSGNLYRIASGGIDPDTAWTRTVLRKTKNYKQLIQGYSFHYYTVCHGWDKKGSAIEFNENDWFLTLKNTWIMEERLEKHITLMDQMDPENTIGLIADEWGNWHDTEPGTNPAFLYQQNTLRDAVTAGLYLNIFNNHARRVKMANIAQTVNVLQAMLLTNGDRMVRTPTFYVFKMYKVHQDGMLLPLDIRCRDYVLNGQSIPAVTASASRNEEKVHISLGNLDPVKAADIEIKLAGMETILKASGTVITAPSMNDYNDFNKPEKVNIKPFSGFKIQENRLIVSLPSKSVITLEIQ